jgi:dihydrofolate reductase
MIALIAAFDKDRAIGRNGTIPWKIDEDMKRFKDLTVGNVVVMGRRTFEDIGRPLPNRLNIVISNTKVYDEKGCITCKSLKEALEKVKGRNVYVSGGEMMYREALHIADILYLTELDYTCQGDAFFPEFSKEDFELVEKEFHQGEIPYTFYTYKRKHGKE